MYTSRILYFWTIIRVPDYSTCNLIREGKLQLRSLESDANLRKAALGKFTYIGLEGEFYQYITGNHHAGTPTKARIKK